LANIDDFILLNAVTGIGSVRLKALLDCFKGPGDILKATRGELSRVAGLNAAVIDGILSIREKFDLDREKRLIKDHGVEIISIEDERYHKLLKNISSAPILLYIKGRLSERDEYAVAIVGSRAASMNGLKNSRRLAMELASLGITVTSGMARGIDAAAHKGALDAGGRTLAVLGSGLARIYPPEHISLAEKIASSGAVISEFPMESPPASEHFPRRNRVISGLSLGVLVVEAAKRSGSLITAGFALEEGRDVFAVPGRPGELTSAGTNDLIRQGAKLVESADDIVSELDISVMDTERGAAEKSTDIAGLSEEEKRIFGLLGEGPMHIDTLSEGLDIPGEKIMGALLRLQSKGVVKELPGKLFLMRSR